MLSDFFTRLDAIFWGYIAFVLIMVFGLVLTIQSNFVQFLKLPVIFKTFWRFLVKGQEGLGVHPLKAFFASTGGMIGIGNVVGVTTAVQCGGPGALIWLWVAGMIGAILKYGEIYLGSKFRIKNDKGSYDGGPMFYLKQAFKLPWLPILTAILLCVYGVEIYQFSVITDSISKSWGVPYGITITVLIGSVVWAAVGGVRRIGEICSWVVPLFLMTYLIMGITIICLEITEMPALLLTIIRSAFTGHAAVGGFAGASFIVAIQHGFARAAYSADIGVGYDSIIQSESSSRVPEGQAALAILGVFIDNMICTITILMVLASGAWTHPGEGSTIVHMALSKYFPGMDYFLPLFYLVTGYTTLIAYFCVGIKSCCYLFPESGKRIYIFFGVLMFALFSFVSQTQALLVMSLAGAFLLIINLLGIFKLRHEINFLETVVAVKN